MPETTESSPHWTRTLLQRLIAALAAVAAMTIIGPFATFGDLNFTHRLAYWGSIIVSGFVIFETLMNLAYWRLHPLGVAWPYWVGLAGMTGALVQTAVVMIAENMLRGRTFDGIAGFAELYVYVLVVCVLIGGLPTWMELRQRGILGRARPEVPDPPAAPASAMAAQPRDSIPFLRRLPAHLGRDLLALEMEDHYVRAHTLLGSTLILMRLRDAIDELDGLAGLQVHRSYWVAASGVTAFERRMDGKLTLILRNGQRVPVSRTHAPAVRTAGWLEGLDRVSAPGR